MVLPAGGTAVVPPTTAEETPAPDADVPEGKEGEEEEEAKGESKGESKEEAGPSPGELGWWTPLLHVVTRSHTYPGCEIDRSKSM